MKYAKIKIAEGIDCGVIGVKKKVQVLEMYLYIVKV